MRTNFPVVLARAGIPRRIRSETRRSGGRIQWSRRLSPGTIACASRIAPIRLR